MDEIWKDIEGYEGYYQVSNLGKVRSVDRTVVSKIGIPSYRKGRVLAPKYDTYGYVKVGLSKNHEVKNITIHRLVAKAFIPNPENKPEINHINAIKDDNRVENLEWCTQEENIHHEIINKLSPGITPVTCIEDNLSFETYTEAARYYGVDITTIIHSCTCTPPRTSKLLNKTFVKTEELEEYNKLSEEEKKPVYKRSPNNIVVKCLDDGKIFDSIRQASRYYDVTVWYFTNYLRNTLKNPKTCTLYPRQFVVLDSDE